MNSSGMLDKMYSSPTEFLIRPTKEREKKWIAKVSVINIRIDLLSTNVVFFFFTFVATFLFV